LGRRKVGESYSGPIREVKAKLPHWGAALDSAQHDVVEGAGRRFRTKSGRASRRGPRGMASVALHIMGDVVMGDVVDQADFPFLCRKR